MGPEQGQGAAEVLRWPRTVLSGRALSCKTVKGCGQQMTVLVFEGSLRAPLSVVLDHQQGIWESDSNADPRTLLVFREEESMPWMWQSIGTKSVKDTDAHPRLRIAAADSRGCGFKANRISADISKCLRTWESKLDLCSGKPGWTMKRQRVPERYVYDCG